MDKIFRVLSDPTRRAILRLLRSGDMSAGEIAQHFSIAKSTLSGHFNLLEDAQLPITERCNGYGASGRRCEAPSVRKKGERRCARTCGLSCPNWR